MADGIEKKGGAVWKKKEEKKGGGARPAAAKKFFFRGRPSPCTHTTQRWAAALMAGLQPSAGLYI